MTKRHLWSLLVVTLIGALILGYFLPKIRLKIWFETLRTANWWWMSAAVLCIALYLGLEGVVTKVLMRGDRSFTFKKAIRIPLIEQLFNGITPFSSGGQPAQLVAMLQSGVEGGKASSVLLMKFVTFQSMIVVTFLISLLIGFRYLAQKISYLSWLVLLGFLIHLVVIVGLLLIMYCPAFTTRLTGLCLKPLGWFMSPDHLRRIQIQLDHKINIFYHESVRLVHQTKLMLKLFLITLFQLAFYYLIPYFIMLGLGYYHVNLLMVVSLHVLIFMIISLFPIPGGSGGAEYGFTSLFKSYITSPSKLVLAMVIWRFLTYYLGIILGIGAMLINPNSKK